MPCACRGCWKSRRVKNLLQRAIAMDSLGVRGGSRDHRVRMTKELTLGLELVRDLGADMGGDT